jgi:hypothetical protein
MTLTPEQLPLSLTDYLLSHLAQECCEIAVRCTKAQMFGLDEIQPEQEFTNRQRITHELCDLLALCEVMRDRGLLPDMDGKETNERLDAKKIKAEKYRFYSVALNRLAAEGKP